VLADCVKLPWCCESDGFPPPLMQTTVTTGRYRRGEDHRDRFKSGCPVANAGPTGGPAGRAGEANNDRAEEDFGWPDIRAPLDPQPEQGQEIADHGPRFPSSRP
jgi:hypothetical protein